MVTGSNSQAAFEDLVERCNDALLRGRDGGIASLESYRDAGAGDGDEES